MTETTETVIPNDFLGINPAEINKKLVSWGISLDEVVQKLAYAAPSAIAFTPAALFAGSEKVALEFPANARAAAPAARRKTS